mmetsp:Transcript_24581/g.56710  ORF Transcript_24581/g.56710 Transcript_24581/m.56710 type:complete len:214 (+) Transcript_24581:1883-2524(+)
MQAVLVTEQMSSKYSCSEPVASSIRLQSVTNSSKRARLLLTALLSCSEVVCKPRMAVSKPEVESAVCRAAKNSNLRFSKPSLSIAMSISSSNSAEASSSCRVVACACIVARNSVCLALKTLIRETNCTPFSSISFNEFVRARQKASRVELKVNTVSHTVFIDERLKPYDSDPSWTARPDVFPPVSQNALQYVAILSSSNTGSVLPHVCWFVSA